MINFIKKYIFIYFQIFYSTEKKIQEGTNQKMNKSWR